MRFASDKAFIPYLFDLDDEDAIRRAFRDRRHVVFRVDEPHAGAQRVAKGEERRPPSMAPKRCNQPAPQSRMTCEPDGDPGVRYLARRKPPAAAGAVADFARSV
jgi:hypothetical protein